MKKSAFFAAALAASVVSSAAMAQTTPPASTGNNANAADQRENYKVNAEPSMGGKEAPRSPAPTSNTSDDARSSVHDVGKQSASDGSGKGEPTAPAGTNTRN